MKTLEYVASKDLVFKICGCTTFIYNRATGGIYETSNNCWKIVKGGVRLTDIENKVLKSVIINFIKWGILVKA